MKVEFLDLKKINKKFEKELKQSFSLFLDSGYYILGNQVRAFEKEFANYCGVKQCIGVGNGLDALFLILKGYIELGKLRIGDHVIVAANTYIATILAISNAGLIPVLVDPDVNTHNLDPKLVLSNITKESKAILVTHLYGQLADMDSLRYISDSKGLLLISDSAQAHGAENDNLKKAGALADASGFSFYPTKNLGALGDGGAVTTSDLLLADCIRKIRNYGTTSKYVNKYIGFNSRLDEIQASFLRIKLKYLDDDNELRRTIAEKYITGIKNEKVKVPSWNKGKNHVFHQFVLKIENRDVFQAYLLENGIETLIHYPIPTYKQVAFKDVITGDYPITEELCNQVLSLPINPLMKENEIDFVIKIVNAYLC